MPPLSKKEEECKKIAELVLTVAYGMESSTANVPMTVEDTAGLFKPDLFAEDILKISPEYLLGRCDVTDWAGRSFKNITAFEYAVWARDFKMLEMMLNHVSSSSLKSELLQQYEQMMNKGLSYELKYEKPILNAKGIPQKDVTGNWETESVTEVHTEKHFDLKLLIDKLEDYRKAAEAFSRDERIACWIKIFGTAQRLFPIHLLQRYCDPNTPFDPVPAFENLDFKRAFIFVDRSMMSFLWAPTSILSSTNFSFNCALSRRNNASADGPGVFDAAGVILSCRDLAALRHLDEVSTNKMQKIKEALCS